MNQAAVNGVLKLLQNKCSVWGLFPTTDGANGAATNGHFEVLNWLAALESKGAKVYPNQDSATWAAANGNVGVLKWLAKLKADGHQVYPNQDGANWAAENE